MNTDLILGIDATNLRDGGGQTHLIELLSVADPLKHGFKKIIVWGSKKTLNHLSDNKWLIKKIPLTNEQNLLLRINWQIFSLSKEAKALGCNIILVPGGVYMGNFKPYVTICQNMLPFEFREIQRFGFSLITLKLLVLKWAQSLTFNRAQGLIFLTKYAKSIVKNSIRKSRGLDIIIPHGLNKRFSVSKNNFYPIGSYTDKKPFRILYVSPINFYKHQWNVVEAINDLRKDMKWPIVLDLVGPAYQKNAFNKLNKVIKKLDPKKNWVKYHGKIPYPNLHKIYSNADLGIFASTCENMPITLIEMMAAGLPIACSEKNPMPEVLEDAGMYFDPEKPSTIFKALKKLIEKPKLRKKYSLISTKLSKKYNWTECTNETFKFIKKIYLSKKLF